MYTIQYRHARTTATAYHTCRRMALISFNAHCHVYVANVAEHDFHLRDDICSHYGLKCSFEVIRLSDPAVEVQYSYDDITSFSRILSQ